MKESNFKIFKQNNLNLISYLIKKRIKRKELYKIKN
jgi:hypothetical protein